MARPRRNEAGLTVVSTQGHVSLYAELAAKRPGSGIKVHFDNEAYPSPEVCRQDLVRFRNSFSALKAKDQRESTRYGYDARFDKLGCFIEKTASGWAAVIKSNHFVPQRVTDLDDQPVKEFTAEYERFRALQIQASVDRNPTCSLSKEEEDFFWDFDPEMARRVYEDLGWPLPTEGTDDE